MSVAEPTTIRLSEITRGKAEIVQAEQNFHGLVDGCRSAAGLAPIQGMESPEMRRRTMTFHAGTANSNQHLKQSMEILMGCRFRDAPMYRMAECPVNRGMNELAFRAKVRCMDFADSLDQAGSR